MPLPPSDPAGAAGHPLAAAPDDQASLRLPEVLDARAAPPLAQALLARCGADLLLDGAAVQRLGAQCLQVLLSAHATWEASGLRLRITEPSDGLLQGLELLGAGPATTTLLQQDAPA